MATFNSCQFIGRLGKDPDFSVIPSGTSVAKFSLAVDQGKDKQAMWLNVVAWDKLAEIVEKYAEKGMQVFVQGRLQMRAYEDKSGVKRLAVDLVASPTPREKQLFDFLRYWYNLDAREMWQRLQAKEMHV
jgi:single-strand DNA-binding protein